jgi:hypothetical protein
MLAPQYAPRASASLSGVVTVGHFGYAPYEHGDLEADQLEDTTVGDIRLTDNVDAFVENAISSELKFAGAQIKPGAPIKVQGKVEKFEADAFGVGWAWRLAIRFQIIRAADNKQLFDERFSVEKHGSGEERNSFPSAVVAACIAQFLGSELAAELLSSHVAEAASAHSARMEPR